MKSRDLRVEMCLKAVAVTMIMKQFDPYRTPRPRGPKSTLERRVTGSGLLDLEQCRIVNMENDTPMTETLPVKDVFKCIFLTGRISIMGVLLTMLQLMTWHWGIAPEVW